MFPASLLVFAFLSPLSMLMYSGFERVAFYQCRCITGKEISILILSGQYIAIALVDKHKLR